MTIAAKADLSKRRKLRCVLVILKFPELGASALRDLSGRPRHRTWGLQHGSCREEGYRTREGRDMRIGSATIASPIWFLERSTKFMAAR